MFKFLKSKKGFTLVELMIVVVIMAILVAVAVPIYSAVTANAKRKTCAANQREIQSQLSNAAMSNIIAFKDGDAYELASTSTESGSKQADGGTWTYTGTKDNDQHTAIEKLFQKAPYCPITGNKITVKITSSGITGAEEAGMKITTGCSDTTNKHENAIS